MLLCFSKKLISSVGEKLKPSLLHKLMLITKISSNQLPLVKWDLIYFNFLRD